MINNNKTKSYRTLLIVCKEYFPEKKILLFDEILKSLIVLS